MSTISIVTSRVGFVRKTWGRYRTAVVSMGLVGAPTTTPTPVLSRRRTIKSGKWDRKTGTGTKRRKKTRIIHVKMRGRNTGTRERVHIHTHARRTHITFNRAPLIMRVCARERKRYDLHVGAVLRPRSCAADTV